MASASPGGTSIVDEVLSLFHAQQPNEEVLEKLTSSHIKLDRLIRSKELSDETCACLIHLIAKSTNCERPSMRQMVLDLLNFFCDSPIFDKRGADLLLRQHESKQHEYTCLLTDYISVLEKINLMMPASMVSTQMIGLITLLHKQVEEAALFERKESAQVRVEDLHNNLLVKIAEKAKEQRVERNRRELPEDKWKPPEDFRQLPVIPVENDLIYETLFLRKNKKVGEYTNLDHYLDVQFRLYKEDCVVPLREAYEEFILKDKNNRNFRLDSGRIYRDVKIWNGTSTSAEHGEVFIVEMSSEHRKRIKWNNSKRLTFGSLLIMSFDRFHSTFFAVVADSDPERLRDEGLFKVKIYRTRQNQPIPRETPGIILEATSAYFEAYYHVLLALQSIGDFMPFEQYIVKCNKQIDLPKYLSKDPEAMYDLTPTIKGMAIWSNIHSFRPPYHIEITNSQGWPSKECLKMDESQRQAFISALTKEFVLIQGPPGTGKTYLGLQIAKALLHNVDVWKVVDREEGVRNQRLPRPKVKRPCLLVVCYTNHALDQFVEGIINFLPEDKRNVTSHGIPDVIRIGSRCKNEVVEKYNIKHFRYRVGNRVEQQTVIDDADKARKNVLLIRAALKAIQNRRVVVSLNNMKQVMAQNHAEMFNVDTWFDWLHASTKCWSEESQKKKKLNKHKEPKPEKKEEDHMADLVVQTEYEINERSLDDDTDFPFDENMLGINLDNQLDEMVKAIANATFHERLAQEAEQVLEELRDGSMADDNMMKNLRNISKVNLKDRWKMYRYWLYRYVNMLRTELQTREENFNKIFDNYRKAKAEIDEAILRETSVIAVTTTAAAKYHDSLMKIGPQITIIEEAAEVPEAHIVTAINPDCEHLILIGDHKQLEPKPAVQKLAMKYNLSISLFERMLNNGLHYNCLQRQHRMRPEISNLVRHMYPLLEDNDNVLDYEDIRGISHNLFFVSHEYPEHFNEDGKSFSNEHEANYIKQLCLYLLKQGYQASDLTIIAAYTGQMFLIRSKMPRDQFFGVNICVLDNYQGEENEIIILSLVRSNEYGDIGFLRRENRICVALSRAKKGLYILGNSKTLEIKTAEWRTVIGKIRTTSIDGEEVCLLGNSLPLFCQNHPKTKIMAKMPSDFEKAPEGGCDRKCEQRLECGHVCRLFCHPYDKDHKKYKCWNACYKRCPEDHVCNKSCHYPKPCNCSVMMDRTLSCGHSAKLACFIDPNEHNCQIIVNRDLNCGHSAELACYLDPNEYKCQFKVKHDLECGHDVTLACHIDFTKHMCTKLVSDTRNCGHSFERKCFDHEYEKRTLCEVDVEKTFPECQHTKIFPCHIDIRYRKCEKLVEKIQDCGHVRVLPCRQWRRKNLIPPCTDKCEKTCQNGHICQLKCHFPSPCNCKVKMDKILPGCGHEARLECNVDEKEYKECSVGVNLIMDLCGHSISVPCKTRSGIEKEESKYARHLLEEKLKCSEDVAVTLPSCGHEATTKCWQKVKFKSLYSFMSIETFLGTKCLKNVQFKMKCGHSGSYKCWEKTAYEKEGSTKCLEGDGTIKCREIVSLDLKCGHTVDVECWKEYKYMNRNRKESRLIFPSLSVNDYLDFLLLTDLNIKCQNIVDLELKCGHIKKVFCWERLQYEHERNKRDAVGYKCNEEVEVVLTGCGHLLKIKCFERKTVDLLRPNCKKDVLYTYEECGHNVQIKCYQKQQYISSKLTNEKHIIPPCKIEIERKLRCGHSATAICSSREIIECSKGCEQKLVCRHSCSRACKICQENSSHMECQMICEQKSFCGHQCESKTCMNCLPCKKKCDNWCRHKICSHKCIKPCQPCSQPCSWACKHLKCTKLCFEQCDRPRCDKECDKILPCGHKCSGFCGEPCPKSCIDCNASLYVKEKVDSKFCSVTLVECNHSFDHNFLDQHMEENKYKLLSSCPQCDRPIRYHPRYNQILKTQKMYAEKVKSILDSTTNQTKFPICDASDIQKLHNYVGKFMTFLQLTKFTERDREKIVGLEKLQTKGKRLLDRIERANKSHLQTWFDIADDILTIHLLWMAEIIQRNEELRERQYPMKQEHQASTFDEDSELFFWASSEATKTSSCPRDIIVQVEGKQIVSDIQNFQGQVEKQKWKTFLKQIQPYFTNIPQAMGGMEYPQLTTVIGTHVGDWLICPKDHLTPSVLRRECVTCSDKDGNDNWLERFNPILPKFEISADKIGESHRQKGKKNWKKMNFSSVQDRILPNANEHEIGNGFQRGRGGQGRVRRGRGRGRSQSRSEPQDDTHTVNQAFDIGVVRQENHMTPEPQNFLESLFVQPQHNNQRQYEVNRGFGQYRGRGRPPRRGGPQERNDVNFQFRDTSRRGVGRGGQRGPSNHGNDATRGHGRGRRGDSRPTDIGHAAFGSGAQGGSELNHGVDARRGGQRGSGRNSRRGFRGGRRGGR